MNLSLSELEFPIYFRLDRALTDEELMQFSAENEPLRVEREPNGEIIGTSPGGSGGGFLEAQVLGDLVIWARLDGRGIVFSPSAGFALADSSVRAADAAWVSLVRWDALTPDQQESYAPICPEFVIEVRSRSDGVAALERKMEQWVRNGAQLAWMIDPQRRVVAVYRPGGEVEVHEDPSSVHGDGPVRGFELVMARVWG